MKSGLRFGLIAASAIAGMFVANQKALGDECYTTETFTRPVLIERAIVAPMPVMEGSHFTILNGMTVQLSDPSVRRVNLERKIIDRQLAGRISTGEANLLRSQLARIAAVEISYRSKGPLSNREARQLYNALDNVADKLDDFD